MTAYLDEYNPNANRPNCRVQSDPARLKYNNIQSCIAVALHPGPNGDLVGVHLTTLTTGNLRELQTACQELSERLGAARNCNAYLVANYKTYHAGTRLKKELKKLAKNIYVCNVSQVSPTNTAADVDVKIELVGNRPRCYVRLHAPLLRNSQNQVQQKQQPPGGWRPGQPRSKLDTAEREWMVVDFVRA